VKCPLTFHLKDPDRLWEEPGIECIRSGCAWWDTNTAECAVFMLANSFEVIADTYYRGPARTHPPRSRKIIR